MVEYAFVLCVYHFWMRNKPILKYAQFRPILSHFPLSTGQIFNPISPHENIINFFQLKYISILHIKRHQKITQAKVFENFTSRQHALMCMIIFIIRIIINLFHIIITTITMKKGWERGSSREAPRRALVVAVSPVTLPVAMQCNAMQRKVHHSPCILQCAL